MRFPGIHLVEQTEQKFRRFESVLKKTTGTIWLKFCRTFEVEIFRSLQVDRKILKNKRKAMTIVDSFL